MTVPEPHGDSHAIILNLKDWETRSARHLRHLQRRASPLLDDPATVEGACDQRVPWARLMWAKQLLRRQAEVERARRRDLQSVVINRYANGSAADGIVAVAQGVGQRLSCGQRWVQGLVNPLEAVRLEPPRLWAGFLSRNAPHSLEE